MWYGYELVLSPHAKAKGSGLAGVIQEVLVEQQGRSSFVIRVHTLKSCLALSQCGRLLLRVTMAALDCHRLVLVLLNLHEG